MTVTGPDAGEAEAYATALAISTLADSRALLASRPELGALVVPTDDASLELGTLTLTQPEPRLLIG